MASYYVDWQTGNDANAGTTWATAYRTLEKALISAQGSLSAGTIDRVFVRSGIYFLTTVAKAAKANAYVVVFGLGGVLLLAGNRECSLRINNRCSYTFHGVTFGENAVAFITNTLNYGNTFYLFSCGLHNNAFFYEAAPLTSYIPHFNCKGATFQGTTGDLLDLNGTGGTPPVFDSTDYCVFNQSISSQGFFPNLEVFPCAYQHDSAGSSFLEPYYLSSLNNLETPGIFTRYNTTTTIFRKFAGGVWIVDPSGPGATFDFFDNDRIVMKTGDNGRVLSPVFYYSAGIAFRRLGLNAVEFNFSGLHQVIDSTPADSVRTIEYRISDNPFMQTDVSPAWITVDRAIDIDPPAVGKYLQLRLTFALGAVG